MSDIAARVDAILHGPIDIAAAIPRLQRIVPSLADPRDPAELLGLLRCLHQVGRHDLPLGRLFEGHLDALQIVGRYGAPGVAAALAGRGTILGVWNADLPGEPLRFEGGRLSGGKGFASGAGILSHALVTADVPGGRQILLLDLAETPPAIDTGWWHTIGMARSQTHLVRWADTAVPAPALVGQVNEYAREPWFSGGALRFVAVQAGGVAGILDRVRDHLVATGRAGDPHQAGRLAALFGLADRAAGAVRAAAETWFVADDPVRLARVAAARVAVAAAADEAMMIAQQAVGVQGLFVAHPLAGYLTDLMVYLRQPAPDAQRMKVGQAVADGLLTADL